MRREREKERPDEKKDYGAWRNEGRCRHTCLKIITTAAVANERYVFIFARDVSIVGFVEKGRRMEIVL